MNPNKYREVIVYEVNLLRTWLVRIEEAAKSDDVIPWITVDAITRSANAILYEAGRVNGAQLTDGKEQSK